MGVDVTTTGPAPNVDSDAVVAVVEDLKCEYGQPLLGLGTATPRLSWKISTAEVDWCSDRYEIESTTSDGRVEAMTVEDGGQLLVPWPFRALQSREQVTVRVRVGSDLGWTAFSAALTIETGLLDPSDWAATCISPQTLGGLEGGAPVLFQRIWLPQSPVRARLYVSALGLYEFSIDGERVGDQVLTPGWTAYQHRLRYQTYDVTDQIGAGELRLAALLGNGWYRGQLVWPGNRSSYGDRLGLIAQLELEFADGSQQTVVTDNSWRAAPSPILFDDLYDGQRTDLQIAASPDHRQAEPTASLDLDPGTLVAPSGPPVRVTEVMPARSILVTSSGAQVVDFGQNIVGWVRLTVRGGRRADRVVVRHAEVLEHGELGTRPLRSAKATSEYILSGADTEILQPTFTFNGFRYAEVSGVADLQLDDVQALVLGTDLQRTGWFETSDPQLNRLHQNVVWSMRGNFLDIPTDCPQRDERLGWTGDLQVFAPAACYLFDTAGFLSGWLEDLAAEQHPDGGVPYVIPDVLRGPVSAAAGWSDAATLVPETLYRFSGDRSVLERQYRSMCAWAQKVIAISDESGLWTTGDQFGDWLDPTAPPENAAAAQADPAVVATAYFARTLRAVADTAAVLGLTTDAVDYRAHEERVRAAFIQAYVDADGLVVSDCQTVYALVLCWDLFLDQRQRYGAAGRLAELVEQAGYTVSTGFLGTPLILQALTESGRSDLAYAMLMQTECPSWLYAVTMGATTIWERWDSMLPDGSINPGSMTSFNHYAYGAVADWLHRDVAGIDAVEPGYRRIRIRPVLPPACYGLTQVEARHESGYGTIAVRWAIDDDIFTLTVEVPYGVTADVWLPGAREPRIVRHGHHRFAQPMGVV